MAWYPGKYAAMAAAAAARAAKEAVEVGKTIVTQGPGAATQRAKQDLAAAYSEADRAWEQAKNDALTALGVAAQLREFQERARSIAKQHESLIKLAQKVANGVSQDAYKVIAGKIVTAGAIATEADAQNLVEKTYGPSHGIAELQAAIESVSKSEGLRTLSVGNNAAIGLVVGVEAAGLGPPILRHDFKRWIPVPYREGAVALGGIVSAAAGVSVGVFKRAANRQWGNFVKMTWGGGEVVGGHLSIFFNLQDGDFEGFDVGGELTIGIAPADIYASIGRTICLPLLYPTHFYD